MGEVTIVYREAPIDEELVYTIARPDGGWRRRFTEEELRKLRPIAETLAMMDGNAFFTLIEDHYHNYLQEADAIYRNNGGDNGHAANASWISDYSMIQEDPTLKDLWDKLQEMIELKRK